MQESLSSERCSGVMGVPITFLDKYNPEQFEIVGMGCGWNGNSDLVIHKYQGEQKQYNKDGSVSVVSKLNDGTPLIELEKPWNNTYYEVEGRMFYRTYGRILIKRRNDKEN